MRSDSAIYCRLLSIERAGECMLRQPATAIVVLCVRGCQVGVEIPAQTPPETSPKVAQLAVASVGYYRRLQLVNSKFNVSELSNVAASIMLQYEL